MTPIRHAVTGISLLLATSLTQAQPPQEQARPVLTENPAPDRPGNGSDDSTVVYDATYFEAYNPNSANDMLDRIPGLDLGGRGGGGGGRGLGTGGNLLINGERIAGKENSPRDQLDRIAARDVRRIEIIRDTSGELNVRGASEVINIVLDDAASRSEYRKH